MTQTQSFSNSTVLQIFNKYTYRILVFVAILTFLLCNSPALAVVVKNPGATCNTNFAQGSFTSRDYNNLVSAVDDNSYVNILGNAAGSIPLQIKVSTSESSASTTKANFGIVTQSSDSTITAINTRRTFPTVSDYTDITFDFRNNTTLQPIYLTNFALSAFDVDYSNNTSNYFDDNIIVTGRDQNNVEISGTLQTIAGSNITSGSRGIYTSNTSDPNCTGQSMDVKCQASIKFSQPIKSVKIRYTNYTLNSNKSPTNQEIDFRVDNYCYVPEYIFSGTVFDDNGGIPENRANKDNADITTPSSIYTNRPKYFNGEYDPTFSETGISGSTVRLTNCSNTSTTYPTQSVLKNGAPVGEYQISIPKTTLGNNTNLCLIENRTGDTYPIRTSNENKNVGFTTTNYNYPDNNFGRVIAENAALVLRKAQYVNNCRADINYTDSKLNIAGNTNPNTGFSEYSITDNLNLGQCIAYRITATNRANSPINNFVMQDKLQKKEPGGALVTSVLANPISNTVDYASDSVPIGQNGVVKTNSFVLPLRSKRVFYFNTKYGTTVDP
ncbi:hypothetical protein [Psychrobacter glacincola]|uniref:hypothetical protein n=1 Tax=Psychrobacter glacincola TaxID=56810 RepID=UPI0039B1062E